MAPTALDPSGKGERIQARAIEASQNQTCGKVSREPDDKEPVVPNLRPSRVVDTPPLPSVAVVVRGYVLDGELLFGRLAD